MRGKRGLEEWASAGLRWVSLQLSSWHVKVNVCSCMFEYLFLWKVHTIGHKAIFWMMLVDFV
jgi:hypothetical protein